MTEGSRAANDPFVPLKDCKPRKSSGTGSWELPGSFVKQMTYLEGTLFFLFR